MIGVYSGALVRTSEKGESSLAGFVQRSRNACSLTDPLEEIEQVCARRGWGGDTLLPTPYTLHPTPYRGAERQRRGGASPPQRPASTDVRVAPLTLFLLLFFCFLSEFAHLPAEEVLVLLDAPWRVGARL